VFRKDLLERYFLMIIIHLTDSAAGELFAHWELVLPCHLRLSFVYLELVLLGYVLLP
jgi:hypothetical protein